jgi:hypothetical protein
MLSLAARMVRDELLRRFGTTFHVGDRAPWDVIAYVVTDVSVSDKRLLKRALEELLAHKVAHVKGGILVIDAVANREVAKPFEAAPDASSATMPLTEDLRERESSFGASASPPTSEQTPTRADMVAKVFAHWQTVMAKPRAKLAQKRSKLIEAALVLYGLDECLKAVDGCAKSDWHMARDARNRTTFYNSVELIFRDCEKIERFISIAERAAAAPASEPAPKKLTAEERGLLVRGNMRENNDRLHRLREGLPPPTPEELASIRDGSM